jgi:hypothetical protein
MMTKEWRKTMHKLSLTLTIILAFCNAEAALASDARTKLAALNQKEVAVDQFIKKKLLLKDFQDPQNIKNAIRDVNKSCQANNYGPACSSEVDDVTELYRNYVQSLTGSSSDEIRKLVTDATQAAAQARPSTTQFNPNAQQESGITAHTSGPTPEEIAQGENYRPGEGRKAAADRAAANAAAANAIRNQIQRGDAAVRTNNPDARPLGIHTAPVGSSRKKDPIVVPKPAPKIGGQRTVPRPLPRDQ